MDNEKIRKQTYDVNKLSDEMHKVMARITVEKDKLLKKLEDLDEQYDILIKSSCMIWDIQYNNANPVYKKLSKQKDFKWKDFWAWVYQDNDWEKNQ